ncbi:MAG: aminotransferase DegT [Candidatus Brocadia sp. UTAMX2]|jgi:aminotransferase in exopolysaccharide biosynthesis|nr:MAG: aminotransferase DegT [Candidatus Brocadia sp. UTAMX2]
MFEQVVKFIKDLYGNPESVSLHEPRFIGNEKRYVAGCIDSTFVSSVGEYVNRFESMVADYVGVKYAVATVNGTSALHAALIVAGIGRDEEVLTQALTFVATSNAIVYAGGRPVFIDSDRDTLGMGPEKLAEFLRTCTVQKDDGCYNKKSGCKIRACVPVHIFGHPAKIDLIRDICDRHRIVLIEDAAESLGSFYKGRHTGTFGSLGVLSFNGNKIITTGGGGMIITDDKDLARRAKHITTTSRLPHKWIFVHDEVGYNYRMPNINAALGCAQMEQLPVFLESKRTIAKHYRNFFEKHDIPFFVEPANARSNYWLNAIILKDKAERDAFLEYANTNGVMTRPIWALMNSLEMYKGCQNVSLDNAVWLEERVVNIPSSARV